ncbi:MAG: phenylacetate--CoA ligase family protein [Alphaproteobacteria bacterium]|nr:phenylacetate--CoA ligase family protein [Alphaproteobacteria bacterium]
MNGGADSLSVAALASQVPRLNPPEVVWPAVVGGEAGTILAVLQQIELSQWWPPDVLAAQQRRQLGFLLAHAERTVPFYRDRLRAAGFRAGQPLSEEVWRRLPVLERRAVQDAGPALRSSHVPAAHGAAVEVTTTGSTGMPVRVLKTRLADLFWSVCTLRDLRWQRRDVSGKLALILRDPAGRAGWPAGLTLPNWGRVPGVLYASGPAAQLDVMTPVDLQAEWLMRIQPNHLLTFPTNLLHLARHVLERGQALPALRGITTMGELVGADLRALCRAAFGVPLADMYSAEEVGYMALQCPDFDHYHVQAETVRVEILDEADRPCPVGAIGRVVVTPLHNLATPLVRYAIGDYAEVGPPCPCGRGLPVLRRILGRTRNMVRLPSGASHWAALESQRFAEIAPIVQYQLIQTQDGIEMKLVTRRPLERDEEDRLRDLVHFALGHPFAVRFTYHDAIPRSAGGKFEEFRCELGE